MKQPLINEVAKHNNLRCHAWIATNMAHEASLLEFPRCSIPWLSESGMVGVRFIVLSEFLPTVCEDAERHELPDNFDKLISYNNFRDHVSYDHETTAKVCSENIVIPEVRCLI